MKKLFLLTMPFLLSVFLFSCSDDDEKDIEFAWEDNIVDMVFVTNIGEISVKIHNAKGECTVKVENEKVIEVQLNNSSTLAIKGLTNGNAVIHITDSENRKATLRVTVIYREEYFTLVKSSVKVEAENPTNEDQAVIEEIKSEINEKLHASEGKYALIYKSDVEGSIEGVFKFKHADATEQSDIKEGTFRKVRSSVSESIITFSFENKEVSYVYINDIRKTSIAQSYFMHDFIDEYKETNDPKITEAKGLLIIRDFFVVDRLVAL